MGDFLGASGIPVCGREAEYAASLWLAGPSAFWLHPEGPLSETTPDEWRAKRAEEERRARLARLNSYANGLLQNAFYLRQQAQFAATSAAQLLNANCQPDLSVGLLGSLGIGGMR